eukprot:596175-Rhodomonas_salina.4
MQAVGTKLTHASGHESTRGAMRWGENWRLRARVRGADCGFRDPSGGADAGAARGARVRLRPGSLRHHLPHRGLLTRLFAARVCSQAGRRVCGVSGGCQRKA